MSRSKANRCRTHKSKWKTITANEKEFQLDGSGRLLKKFSKSKPRIYLKDLQIYQNKVPSEANSDTDAIIPNQEQNQEQEQDQNMIPKVDSQNKTKNQQESEFVFCNLGMFEDQDSQSDSFFDLGFDDIDNDSIM